MCQYKTQIYKSQTLVFQKRVILSTVMLTECVFINIDMVEMHTAIFTKKKKKLSSSYFTVPSAGQLLNSRKMKETRWE